MDFYSDSSRTLSDLNWVLPRLSRLMDTYLILTSTSKSLTGWHENELRLAVLVVTVGDEP